MKIKWLGHSCFKISSNGYSIVIDPYNPLMFPKLEKYSVKANQVLCTHEHDDHNFREAVTLEESVYKNPFSIEHLTTYHDQCDGKERGKMIVYILKTEQYSIAHLGDIGCKLDENQIKRLKGIDFLMIPVGGFYTIDALIAKELVDAIEPKTVIPMHYRGENFGFPVLGTLDEFTKLFDSEEINYIGSTVIDLDYQAPNKVIVFDVR